MGDFIGIIFIVGVIVGMYRFVVNKHRGIVDRKPDLVLGALQMKQAARGDRVAGF